MLQSRCASATVGAFDQDVLSCATSTHSHMLHVYMQAVACVYACGMTTSYQYETVSPPFAEFDAERRAFSKLEIKKIRHQQAHDTVEADMMAKLEARDATLSGEACTAHCLFLGCPTGQTLRCTTIV